MLAVVLTIAAIGVVYLSVVVLPERRRQGVLRLANGHEYTYWLGDDMPSGYGGTTIRGIDIELPKEFPHLYLDSQKGGGRRAQFVIDAAQRLSLEGDFDQSFQLYAPKGYETLALSIISPDVMRTIMDSACAYDVELYGSHLRLISDRRVFKRAAREQQLMQVAELVLAEIDHRLNSWSSADSKNARNEDLVLYPMRGIRLFGKFVPWQFLFVEAAWVLVSGLFFWMGVELALMEHHPVAGVAVCVVALLLLALLTAINRNGVSTTAFRSRRG